MLAKKLLQSKSTIQSAVSGFCIFNPSGIDYLTYTGYSFYSGNGPQGIEFNTDGTKMFIAVVSGDSVHQYSLSIGFDLSSTITHQYAYDISAQEEALEGIKFNNDGTKMFTTGNTVDGVSEYTLSIGFDLSSTVTFITSYVPSAQITSIYDLDFNNDGTKMFLSGTSSKDMYEYSLSVGFDLTSTITHIATSTFSSVSTYGFIFNDDGTKIFTLTSNDAIEEWSVAVGFDISSAITFKGIVSVAGQDTSGEAITFNPDGTKLFMVGKQSGKVFEYTTTGC